MQNKIAEKIERYIPKFFLSEKSILLVLLCAALGVGIQLASIGPAAYNNYIIFKSSFFHLIYDQNLYRNYWDEYNDLFLYSPTFPLLMVPLVFLPLWLQVLLWCSLNAVCVYFAIKLLPLGNSKTKIAICWFMLFEFITAMQNMQVAPIVASLIIFAFVFFERGNLFKAALFIVLATFIKIYAIAAVILFLLYPGKLKFVVYMLFWTALFVFAPLLVITPHQLMFQYHSWFDLTTSIHQGEETGINPNIAIPLSVMGWLKTWFHLNPPSIYIQLIGTALLCLPFLRRDYYGDIKFRMFIVAALLIWSMIFNHIAESASYIVAIMGVAVWLVADKKNGLTIVLAIAVFVFSSLSPTSLFPKYVKEHLVIPYVLIAVPCIILWFVIIYKLLFNKFEHTASPQS